MDIIRSLCYWFHDDFDHRDDYLCRFKWYKVSGACCAKRRIIMCGDDAYHDDIDYNDADYDDHDDDYDDLNVT